jgi:hypothetical protein
MNSCTIYIRNGERERERERERGNLILFRAIKYTRERERRETNSLSNNKLWRRVSKLNMVAKECDVLAIGKREQN